MVDVKGDMGDPQDLLQDHQVDIRQELWQVKGHFWVVVSNIVYFHPYLGKLSNLTNVFQMGWNHQPDEEGLISERYCWCFRNPAITSWYSW